MQKQDAKELLDRYSKGIATEEEVETLLSWIQSAELTDKSTFTSDELESVSKEIWSSVDSNTTGKPPVRLWPRMVAAASVIFIIGFSGYFLFRGKLFPDQHGNIANDVNYGTQKAILKMGNGKTIVLDNSATGVLARHGTTNILKTGKGQIAYSGTLKNDPEIVYDTIRIPAGGNIYRLKLADGSKITLNVATTLVFPESFDPKERKITLLSGEAYFEVAHNATVPFRVIVNGQLVEDIGTHFNISAYHAEPVITTLLEGSIRVSSKEQKNILIPGQQAVTGTSNTGIIIRAADTDEAVAWTQGLFMFNDEKLGSIMKQVGRWYDLDVLYNDAALRNKLFSGSVSRFSNVSQVLSKMQITGSVHFKIEGRRVVVMK